MKSYIALAALLLSNITFANTNRWSLNSESSNAITMDVKDVTLPHSDHIEMSGKMMAVVLYWQIDSNQVFSVDRSLVFPMLRTVPNNTHASLMHHDATDVAALLKVNGKPYTPKVSTITLDGEMIVNYAADGNNNISLRRLIFPSMEHQALIERFTAYNTGSEAARICVPKISDSFTTDAAKGVKGSYIIRNDLDTTGCLEILPGDSLTFNLITQAYVASENNPVNLDCAVQHAMRRKFIDTIDNNLVLHTPSPIIDTEFRFAKIRGSESICRTKGGYMHAPGGESYYAALWANDQAEYINPFFPFLGYDVGNESALNCFRHYMRFINDDYKPLPSSIIAEGDDVWCGAGDRGDAAMIAYGATRYALARADLDQARELWPLITWCLEYCKRKLNAAGVVESDHDELEGRFPAGSANLCTSTLYYDALLSAAHLGRELGIDKHLIRDYTNRANLLKDNIESYFGANVQGYETYRYYDGCDILRSWICMPLVMGINDRAQATAEALFSDKMYTDDGVLTAQGSDVFWDRATLYTLRGTLCAGMVDKSIQHLADYSERRLLGDHVPYPIEAWPEGSQRHLSAESGLYCRVITEGLFGIRPTGFRSFNMIPQLPEGWDFAQLSHIRAFGADFDVKVERMAHSAKLLVTVTNHDSGIVRKFKASQGQTLKINL